MMSDKSKFKIFIWTLYDFANTSFSIVVVTFLFAVYFKETIAEGKSIGDLYWSVGASVSMIITALIAPILGAIADHSAGKKRFLLFFTLQCIAATSILYFMGQGDIFWALVLFIVANVGFEAGLVFYDAFLPEITHEKNYGRVSGYGFAMGYLGSLATLAAVYPFIKNNQIPIAFPFSALFFLVFAAPLFFGLKDNRKDIIRVKSYAKIGFERVWNTITHLKNYRNLASFLLAYFFFIEGVNTVIVFSGIYASTTLRFSPLELIVFFIVVQTTAIFGSVIFGAIADSYGQKKTIIVTLTIWIFTILCAYFASDPTNIFISYLSKTFNSPIGDTMKNAFYFVGLLAGSVMGATQSTSRSMMSKLTPESKKTEFFGFYSFFGKSSAVLGPLVFGFVSFSFNSQRLAILSIIIFFIIGIFLLSKVKDEAYSLNN